jgi:hypothetical protein
LASVNYEGIVEFPTPQTSLSNHLVYKDNYSNDNESKSVAQPEDLQKPIHSADHTIYSQNFQKQNTVFDDRPKVNSFGQSNNLDQANNSTTQSIGNKMWLPGFNMTASSIKSEQSVRVFKDPTAHTPVQYSNKSNNERRPERSIHQTIDKNMNYTPEVHQSKPRTFENANNPSMTTHSMNVASTNMNSVHKTPTRSPISQIDRYEDNQSMQMHTMSDYNKGGFSNTRQGHFKSDNSISNIDNGIPNKGPIKPVDGISTTSVVQPDAAKTFTGFNDESPENRQHRYSQPVNKSLETRHRNKNSLSQKKPPLKNKKFRAEDGERPLSIEGRDEDDAMTEKNLTPDAEWKGVLKNIQDKKSWEKQFKACNTIKDFSRDHPKYFKSSDPYFSEIMNELAILCNSLRTQLSRNALGTYAMVFENLGRKAD